MLYYCVRRLADGLVVYVGTCIGLTASALEPGSCYGWGGDADAAKINSERLRLKIPLKPNREPNRILRVDENGVGHSTLS